MSIEKNCLQVKEKIKQYEDEAGKVKLLAVSKTRSADEILGAYKAGQFAFGESYIQEAAEKIKQLQEYPLEWHFIGRIQSNKIKLIAKYFSWVQTVSDEKTAIALNASSDRLLNVCIQVNISSEPQKAGVIYEKIDSLARTIKALPNLTLRGLMAIAERTDDQDKLMQRFDQLHQAYRGLQCDYDSVDTLSMGMSADMRLAIHCGSTLVRVGTDIFGKRIEKNEVSGKS